VEKAGYRPLLAEVLELIGCVSSSFGDAAPTEAALLQAFFAATEAHDDATAGRAAADLVHLYGILLNRPKDAETWFRISESTLNRLGSGNERTRAWAANNLSNVLAIHGQYERAERLARDAVALKERALGKDHPDVAISLNVLADILNEEGRPSDALPIANRAIEILSKNGDPEADVLGSSHNAKGNALIALGRGIEAETAYSAELRIFQRTYGPVDRPMAFPLLGLGEARVLQRAPAGAIAFLEKALRIQQETREPIAFNVAETQYWLARALWESGTDRQRALRLATEAKSTFSAHETPLRERAVLEWLAEHQSRPRKSVGR
jgi:tetratricopeptide (TPR) repeat protein